MRDWIEGLKAEFRRKVLAPDFGGFEAYYGCPVPPELRQFYGLGERLLAGVLYATCRADTSPARFDLIQYPEPMNAETWAGRYGREFYRFATNTDGYPLLVKPALARSPVFADWGYARPIPDIEELEFTLAEVVGTLGSNS